MSCGSEVANTAGGTGGTGSTLYLEKGAHPLAVDSGVENPGQSSVEGDGWDEIDGS